MGPEPAQPPTGLQSPNWKALQGGTTRDLGLIKLFPHDGSIAPEKPSSPSAERSSPAPRVLKKYQGALDARKYDSLASCSVCSFS